MSRQNSKKDISCQRHLHGETFQIETERKRLRKTEQSDALRMIKIDKVYQPKEMLLAKKEKKRVLHLGNTIFFLGLVKFQLSR